MYVGGVRSVAGADLGQTTSVGDAAADALVMCVTSLLVQNCVAQEIQAERPRAAKVPFVWCLFLSRDRENREAGRQQVERARLVCVSACVRVSDMKRGLERIR